MECGSGMTLGSLPLSLQSIYLHNMRAATSDRVLVLALVALVTLAAAQQPPAAPVADPFADGDASVPVRMMREAQLWACVLPLPAE